MNSSMILSVISKYAAKVEGPAVGQRVDPVIDIVKRVYFYTINPDYSIPFGTLDDALKSGDENSRKKLLDLLSKGNSGEFCADYFTWIAFYAVGAKRDNPKNLVAYRYGLNSNGTISPADSEIQATNPGEFTPPSPEEAAGSSDFNFFAMINNIPNMIVLDQGSDSVYVMGQPPNNLPANLIKTQAAGQRVERLFGAQNISNYRAFEQKTFANYRIWAAKGELRNPDGSIPDDKLPQGLGTHYKGGKASFDKLTAKYNISAEKEQTPSTPEKSEPTPTAKPVEKEPEFTPVDKTPPTTKEKEDLKFQKSSMEDRDSAIVEINEDDPNANYYLGDFSIMQDLARRQHKKMKVRKESQISAPSTVMPTTMKKKPSTTTPSSMTSEQAKQQSKAHQEMSKALSEYSNAVAESEKATVHLASEISLSTIEQVVNRFLKSI